MTTTLSGQIITKKATQANVSFQAIFVFNQDNSTAPMPAITGHSRYNGSPSPPKNRLIVQSFSKVLFDILECHYSRMKEVLAIQQEQKYKRHRPETTTLYQLVERYYPEFTANLAEQGKYLPWSASLNRQRIPYTLTPFFSRECENAKNINPFMRCA